MSSVGIMVDPAKTEAVAKWEPTRIPTEVLSFMVLVGYYRRFIQDFSRIASSLTKLTRKEVKFIRGQDQKEAFGVLKKKLCRAPVLALPDGIEAFVVYSDVSAKGLGCVFMHHGEVIAYASQKLKEVETRYKTHDLELAAIIFSLKILRHYMYVVVR